MALVASGEGAVVMDISQFVFPVLWIIFIIHIYRSFDWQKAKYKDDMWP